MSDRNEQEEVKDTETESPVTSGSMDGTASTVEKNNTQDVETSANQENNPLPNSESSEAFVTDKTTGDLKETDSDPAASQSPAIDEAVNASSKVGTDPKTSKEVSANVCDSVDAKISHDAKSKEKSDNVSESNVTSSAIDLEAKVESKTVKALSSDEVLEQVAISESSSTSDNSEKASKTENSCAPSKAVGDVNKNGIEVNASKVSPKIPLESSCEEKKSDSVDLVEANLPDILSSKDRSLESLTQPSLNLKNDQNTSEKEAVIKNQEGTDSSSQKESVEALSDSALKSSVEKVQSSETASDKIETCNDKVSVVGDEAIESNGRKVGSTSDEQHTEMELVCKITDITKTNASQTPAEEGKPSGSSEDVMDPVKILEKKVESKSDAQKTVKSKMEGIETKKDSLSTQKIVGSKSENIEIKKDLSSAQKSVKRKTEIIEMKKDLSGTQKTLESKSKNFETKKDLSSTQNITKSTSENIETKKDSSGNHNSMKPKSKVPDKLITVKLDEGSSLKSNIQVSANTMQKEDNSEKVDKTSNVNDNTPTECTAIKSNQISSTSATDEEESSLCVKKRTVTSEPVKDSEKMNVDKENTCLEKDKSKSFVPENKVEVSISTSGNSDDKSVTENGQTSNSAVDEKCPDLYEKTKDTPENDGKCVQKETQIQNVEDQITKKSETAVESEEKSENLCVVEPVTSTQKSNKVSENSTKTIVTSDVKEEKNSDGKANLSLQKESEKTPLLNAIEAVTEEVKMIKSMKGNVSKSSDQEERNHLSKASERKASTENQVTPAAAKDEAVSIAKKQESVKSPVTVNSDVGDKINGTSASSEGTEICEVKEKLPETADSKISVVIDKAKKPADVAPSVKEEPKSKLVCEPQTQKINPVAIVQTTKEEMAIENKSTDSGAESAKAALSVSPGTMESVNTDQNAKQVENSSEKRASSEPNELSAEVKKSVSEEKCTTQKVSVEKKSEPSPMPAIVKESKLSENGSDSSAPKQQENTLDSQDSKAEVEQVAGTKSKEAPKDKGNEIKPEALPEVTGKSNIVEVISDQKVPEKTQQSSNDVAKKVTIKKIETSVKPSTSVTTAPKTVVKPRSSIENDPLLNITSECRVELEITKIPANCQTKLKSETGGKPIFVLNKDSAGSSAQSSKGSDDRKPKSLLKNFVPNSGQPPKMMGTSPRPVNRAGMIKVGADDSAISSNSAGGMKRAGRKRAITIDMTNRTSSSPPVKVVKMDVNNLKPRANVSQFSQPKPFQKSGTSAKTTSALEMLLMNRGVSHNSSISDASVANFCQVEQFVSEPDAYSTPIKQLKKLSTGSANSILKQIAYGSQQFGAITISPVKPAAPPSMSVKPSPPVSFKPGPRPGPIVRSSSVDDVIEGVVAGEGEISDKCLLELNSMGEPKKKRGRPRKIVPGGPPGPPQTPGKEQTLSGARQVFFAPRGPPPALLRLPTFKPAPVTVSAPVPVTVSVPSESEIEAPAPETEEAMDDAEPRKSASGRSLRTCTMKEPKKKSGAQPNSGTKPPKTKKSKKEEGPVEPSEPDPEEEARKQKQLEEEAKRKEEQKERRQEERQKRLELRNQAIAEKKAKLKRRAEERKRQYYEKKQRLQEEKAEMERRRALAPPENFSEETQMGDERDDSLEISRNKKGRMEVIDPESSKEFKVQQVAEYQWPLQGGEFFMLQEQISQYLGVKSFKRKYPDIKRRTIEAEERTFLCDSGLVSETMCDLGLTALRSADVLDIMFADFHDKYEEFRQHLRDMQAKEFSLKQLALAGKPTGEQLDSIEKAVQSAARWNSALNKSRKETRRCFLDLQTFVIQYPRGRLTKVTEDVPKTGKYPVALIPGQFTDHYKQYSAAELRYFPINTVLYGPIKPYNVMMRESQKNCISESEDSSSSDGSSCSSSDASDSEDTCDEVAPDADMQGPEGAVCKICNGNKNKNKRNKPEVLIQCAQCTGSCHPTCLDLSVEMVPYIHKYDWQCTDCKKCARCKEAADEDKMLFCDLCDRGYHIYCVGLRKVPVGRWHCPECAICAFCGVREPGPSENSLWHHEYKRSGRGGKNTYIRSFCESCTKDYNPGEGNVLKKES